MAYVEYAIKKSSVSEWHRRFKEGREDVQDDLRSGQPKTQRRDENVERVRTLVRSDRRLGARVIAGELNMNMETVRQTVMQRYFVGSLPVMKRGVFNTTRKKMTAHAVENTELTSAEKSTHVSAAGQDHASVFLQSQGDSSL